jgi:hypothetical protein
MSTEAMPMVLDHRGGVAHLLRHGAEKLDGEALLGRASGDHLQGALVLLEERAGVDEVGGGPVHAADLAHDEPEGQVGVARQRRQEEVGIQLVGPDAHGRNVGAFSPPRKAEPL